MKKVIVKDEKGMLLIKVEQLNGSYVVVRHSTADHLQIDVFDDKGHKVIFNDAR